jgi:hypothetical protein
LVLFVHLAKEESQAIQPAKEEFATGILWIQGSDLWIWSTSFLNDLVYVYYSLRLWVKQFEIKIDAKAISLDGIETTTAWRVEVEDPVIDTALDWLEDSGDDHGISEDLDQDVPEDIQFHAESASVPPTESQSQSQSEGDRPSGLLSHGL